MKRPAHAIHNMPTVRRCPRRQRRTGAILAVAIVCIAIALMLATALSRAAVVQHRQSQQGINQQQALWLAESGLQRAIFQLRTAPDYAGETWEVPATELDSTHTGLVTIRVQPSGSGDGKTELQVTAKYPAEKTTAATYTRSIVLTASEGNKPATDN